jgi:hypothetical protein
VSVSFLFSQRRRGGAVIASRRGAGEKEFSRAESAEIAEGAAAEGGLFSRLGLLR